MNPLRQQKILKFQKRDQITCAMALDCGVFPEPGICACLLVDNIEQAIQANRASASMLISEAQAGKTSTMKALALELQHLINNLYQDVYFAAAATPLVLIALHLNSASSKTQAQLRLKGCDVLHLPDTGLTTTKGQEIKQAIQVAKQANRLILLISDEVDNADKKGGNIQCLHDAIGINVSQEPRFWLNQKAHLIQVSATPYAHIAEEKKRSSTSSSGTIPWDVFWLEADRTCATPMYGFEEFWNSYKAILSGGSPVGPYLMPVADYDSGFTLLKKRYVKITDSLQSALSWFNRESPNEFFIIRLPQLMYSKINESRLLHDIRKMYSGFNIVTAGTRGHVSIPKFKDMLKSAPKKPTVVLIKMAFSASDTLTKDFIWGAWEGGRSLDKNNDRFLQTLARYFGYDVKVMPIWASEDQTADTIKYINSLRGGTRKLTHSEIQNIRPMKGRKAKIGVSYKNNAVWVWTHPTTAPDVWAQDNGDRTTLNYVGSSNSRDLADGIVNFRIDIPHSTRGSNGRLVPGQVIFCDSCNSAVPLFKNSWKAADQFFRRHGTLQNIPKASRGISGNYVVVLPVGIRLQSPWKLLATAPKAGIIASPDSLVTP